MLHPSLTRTLITRQLLVKIFRIELYKYPFKDLGADTRSQTKGQTWLDKAFFSGKFQIMRSAFHVHSVGSSVSVRIKYLENCWATFHEALCYKPEGRGFDSRWGGFFLILPAPLGSTQPLTEMSTRNLPGVKGGRAARKSDSLTAICEPIV
jgi:hypothetical protein